MSITSGDELVSVVYVSKARADVGDDALAEPRQRVVPQPDEARVDHEQAENAEHDQVELVGALAAHADADGI